SVARRTCSGSSRMPSRCALSAAARNAVTNVAETVIVSESVPSWSVSPRSEIRRNLEQMYGPSDQRNAHGLALFPAPSSKSAIPDSSRTCESRKPLCSRGPLPSPCRETPFPHLAKGHRQARPGDRRPHQRIVLCSSIGSGVQSRYHLAAPAREERWRHRQPLSRPGVRQRRGVARLQQHLRRHRRPVAADREDAVRAQHLEATVRLLVVTGPLVRTRG